MKLRGVTGWIFTGTLGVIACGGKVTNGDLGAGDNAAGGSDSFGGRSSKPSAGGDVAAAGGWSNANGGRDPGGVAGSGQGGSVATGGFVAVGAGGATILPPPPPPPDLLEQLRVACLEACATLFGRCQPGLECEPACGDLVNTFGPCPAAIDLFQCIGARSRGTDGCGADSAINDCFAAHRVFDECPGPLGDLNRVCSLGIGEPAPGQCSVDATLCDGRTYGAQCTPNVPSVADCQCYEGGIPGDAIEVSLDADGDITSVCDVPVLAACGFPVMR